MQSPPPFNIIFIQFAAQQQREYDKKEQSICIKLLT